MPGQEVGTDKTWNPVEAGRIHTKKDHHSRRRRRRRDGVDRKNGHDIPEKGKSRKGEGIGTRLMAGAGRGTATTPET